MTPDTLETHRTKCGRGRVTYHPEWSEERPWATYRNGSAGAHVANLQDGVVYFGRYGMELEVK